MSDIGISEIMEKLSIGKAEILAALDDGVRAILPYGQRRLSYKA